MSYKKMNNYCNDEYSSNHNFSDNGNYGNNNSCYPDDCYYDGKEFDNYNCKCKHPENNWKDDCYEKEYNCHDNHKEKDYTYGKKYCKKEYNKDENYENDYNNSSCKHNEQGKKCCPICGFFKIFHCK